MNTKTLPLYIKKEFDLPLQLEGFTTTHSHNASFQCTKASFSATPKFAIKPSATFAHVHDFDITKYVANKITYTLEVYANQQNSWGYSKNATFNCDYPDDDTLANPLRAGNYNGVSTKVWIPFTIDFGTVTGGIRLVSATLSLNLYEPTSIQNANKPCVIKYGVCKNINPADPTTWSGLNAKVMSTNYGTYKVISDLNQSYTKDLDLTYLLADVFCLSSSIGKMIDGTKHPSIGAISWDNDENIALILQDFKSYRNEYLGITSYSGEINNPDFIRPKLTIVYEDMYYGLSSLSTWTSSLRPTTVRPESPQLLVGEGNNTTTPNINRSLLYFDLSSIPSGATINSATLSLYLEARRSSYTTTFQIYTLNSDKNWDMSTATWNKRFGTQLWTTAGGLDDCSASPIATESFTKTAALGYHTYSLTSTVQGWVTTPANNKGLLLKTSREANDGYTFSSRWSVNASTQKPKLVITYTYGGTTYTNVEFS